MARSWVARSWVARKRVAQMSAAEMLVAQVWMVPTRRVPTRMVRGESARTPPGRRGRSLQQEHSWNRGRRAAWEVAVAARIEPKSGRVVVAARQPGLLIGTGSAALLLAAPAPAAQVPARSPTPPTIRRHRVQAARSAILSIPMPLLIRPGAGTPHGRAGSGSRPARLHPHCPARTRPGKELPGFPVRIRPRCPLSAARVPLRAAPGDPRRCACPRGPDRHVPSPA